MCIRTNVVGTRISCRVWKAFWNSLHRVCGATKKSLQQCSSRLSTSALLANQTICCCVSQGLAHDKEGYEEGYNPGAMLHAHLSLYKSLIMPLPDTSDLGRSSPLYCGKQGSEPVPAQSRAPKTTRHQESRTRSGRRRVTQSGGPARYAKPARPGHRSS